MNGNMIRETRIPQNKNQKRRNIIRPAAAIVVMAILLFSLFWLIKYILVSYDVLITDAVIHNGMKNASPFIGTVAIKGDKIDKVWRGSPWLIEPKATKVINARGLVLSPGFIDAHSHADEGISNKSGPVRADNFISQGITTVVAGNCGRSPVDINTFARNVNSQGINVNIASLLGFNSIRDKVMKDINKPANAIQIEEMCVLAQKGMEDGALGISTGLAYPPGNYASQDELVAVLKVASGYGGLHATHMRNEGEKIEKALNEVIEISRYANIPLLVSHFKITGSENCGFYDKLLETMKIAKSEGIQIHVDQYPYDASSTNLNAFLPDWYLAMSSKTKLRNLRSSTERGKIKKDIREIIMREGLSDLKFATVSFYLPHPEWQGKNIEQIVTINKKTSRSVLDKYIDVILEMESHGGAELIYHNTCLDVMKRIPLDFENMVSTDSAIRYNERKNSPFPHPRGWGSFPRFIKFFVIENRIISLDTAIYRMTSLPAEVFGLKKRGAIEKGYFGDLVLFDLKDIEDKATYESPFLPPRGIIYVIVNGKIVVNNSENIRSEAVNVESGIQDNYPGKFISMKKDR